jgi:hypothetical protein
MALAGVTMIGVALAPGGATADVIRLKNGSVIEVEGWRDAGDAIEFSAGGGIIRILKSEVDRVEGPATRGDLPMYSAPAAPAPAAPDRAAALKQMTDLLRQGDGLGAQTVLTAAEKAGAVRRLAETWQALQVPEGLKELHGKGGQALQAAAEAYAAEGSAAADAREKAERAKAEMQAAQDDLKKAGEQG